MSAGTDPAVPLPPPRRRRRPLPTPSISSRPAPGQQLDVPPGHGAHIYPLATSNGFIGGSYSMDSQRFMLWASRRYAAPDERFVAIVLLALIGFQEVGGHIVKTQAEIGEHVGYSRAHIAWALALLTEDGVLRRVKKGVYQLVPSAALRGGMRAQEAGKRKVPASRPERVHQLDLLKAIMDDPDAPEAFKAMAQVDAKLPEGPRQTKKGKGKA
ncbi:replication/maintenance protein RepL [Streptomyces sp. NPDC058611]|uniref:replication/maintenance protein RepL n=1 Tax=unclassified Streptomyces TaxID=2593676 RepID=UPI00365C7BAA